MSAATSHQITALLKAWEAGQSRALDDLIPIVYRELKRLASRYTRGRTGETLQTTALVHETYLRLVDMDSVGWQDRAHFFAVSARIMRGLLVDAARADEILAIHEAIDHLARLDPRQAQVVEMRYFVGLSVDETAEVLKVSPQSVMRDWRLARAWLRREIEPSAGRSAG